MKNINTTFKIMRPIDFVLIILFITGSFLPLLQLQNGLTQTDPTLTLIAVVIINNEEVSRFNLKELQHEIVTFDADSGLTNNQYNIVEVYNGSVRIKSDNSPDQVGVNMGWIDRNGQIIICLPHRLLIRIIEDYA